MVSDSVVDPDPGMFLVLLNPDASLFVRIRIGVQILPLSSKRRKKTLIYIVLWHLYDFLSLKTDVNVPSKSTKQKSLDSDSKSWSVSQRCVSHQSFFAIILERAIYTYLYLFILILNLQVFFLPICWTFFPRMKRFGNSL